MRVVNAKRGLLDTLIELIGIKSGLLLSREELIRFLEQTYDQVDDITLVIGGSDKWWQGDLDELVAIRAEELDANFILAMYSVGAIPDQRTAYELLVNHFMNNAVPQDAEESQAEAAERVLDEFVEKLEMGEIPKGAEQLAAEYQKRDIMNRNMPAQRQWDGILPLNDLFGSEDVPANTTPKHYFDQRYIDYLNAQSGDLESIHWRQFEYLSGEYFRRHGYNVTVTPPRGDGGVDVIAEKFDPVAGPDLIVVQCRRYSADNPVSIDEVKAFWTSVDEHKATKGMIVTTSHLTTGGHNFIEARKYRLSVIEGENVRKWLLALSSRSVT